MADAWHDPASGTWLITMRSSAYAFGLADDGAVRHLHWGAPLGKVTATALRERHAADPPTRERHLIWATEGADEYVPWGRMRYDEPTLKADYADGNRSVDLRYAGQRITEETGAVTTEVDLEDAAYGLRVTLCYRACHGLDVLERWARIRNGGAEPVALRLAYPANWWLPPRQTKENGGWRLRYLHGGWGAESQLAETRLSAPGKFILESRRGMTSHEFSPWFTLDPGEAAEESGEVWSGQLAWSGSWKLVFEKTSAGLLHACGGWNDFDFAYRLAPGEDVTLPAFAGLYTGGGFGAASREWHSWQRRHVLGRADRTNGSGPGEATEPPLRPVLYNSWEATGFDVTEEGQARLARLAAGIGVETFVVDDGWFTGRHHDRAGLGDWYVDESKFPRGLDPLIATVNELGMRFGLWVEPEMVNPDSGLYRAHPDWVYHFPGRELSQRRNQLMLNLARPDVADWMFATLDRLLSAHDISYVKWDANRSVSEPGWPAAEGNPERVWVDHVHNLYAVFDALRAAHPGVAFQACAGGGGRVDLGILSRVDEVWPSDNTDAWDRLRIQNGFTQAFAPQAMAAWVTDSPSLISGRELPLSFRFHSAMAGALSVGGDLTKWTQKDLAEAAELVARYKQIRPVVQRGHLYRLGPAWQYLSADGAEIVVLAWWGPRPYGSRWERVRLAALDPAARYRDDVTGTEYAGETLLRDGLPLDGESCLGFGSILVRLARIP
jgi:alpha-galactosidase